MAVTRLNHAVLYVRNADESAEFYHDVFGMNAVMHFPGAVFMRARGSANDHDLGLFSVGENAPHSHRGAVGLYHLAWQVETLQELVDIEKILKDKHAYVGATDHGASKSLYGRDIDNIEFEIMWAVPEELMADDEVVVSRRLDLNAELERFGADTPGRKLTS